MNRFYTVDDVAYALGVNRNTVLRWIAEGKLECRRINYEDAYKGFRIPVSALDNFTIENSIQLGLLRAKLARAEAERRIARLELLEYQMEQDAYFYGKMRDSLRDIEV